MKQECPDGLRGLLSNVTQDKGNVDLDRNKKGKLETLQTLFSYIN